MTEALPAGWKWVALEDLCLSLTDGDHQAPPKAEAGVPFITISAMNDGRVNLDRATRHVPHTYFAGLAPERRAQAGDILFSVTGSIGIAAPVEDDAPFVFQRHIAIIRPEPRAVDRHFLLHLLRSSDVSSTLQGAATGTAQLTISLRALRSVRLPVPPMAEQRRIVARIEALFARTHRARADLERALRLAQRQRCALLRSAFDLASSGLLASQSTLVPLRSVVAELEQGWSPRCEAEPRSDESQWAVIKTTAIQDIRFIPEENKRLPTALSPRPNLQIAFGDVLITRAGPRSRVGISCLVDVATPRLLLCDKAYRLRVNARTADPSYVTLMLNAPQVKEEIEAQKSGISDSGLNLRQDDFLAIEVPLPALSEQLALASCLRRQFARTTALEHQTTRALALLDRLERSILAKAFRGELVPQDPSDEPASVTLATTQLSEAAPVRRRRMSSPPADRPAARSRSA